MYLKRSKRVSLIYICCKPPKLYIKIYKVLILYIYIHITTLLFQLCYIYKHELINFKSNIKYDMFYESNIYLERTRKEYEK